MRTLMQLLATTSLSLPLLAQAIECPLDIMVYNASEQGWALYINSAKASDSSKISTEGESPVDVGQTLIFHTEPKNTGDGTVSGTISLTEKASSGPESKNAVEYSIEYQSTVNAGQCERQVLLKNNSQSTSKTFDRKGYEFAFVPINPTTAKP